MGIDVVFRISTNTRRQGHDSPQSSPEQGLQRSISVPYLFQFTWCWTDHVRLPDPRRNGSNFRCCIPELFFRAALGSPIPFVVCARAPQHPPSSSPLRKEFRVQLFRSSNVPRTPSTREKSSSSSCLRATQQLVASHPLPLSCRLCLTRERSRVPSLSTPSTFQRPEMLYITGGALH